MIGLREWCIALLSGAIGVGSAVAVQQAPVPRKAVAKPAPKRIMPRPTPTPAAPSRILDCPLPSADPFGAASIEPFVGAAPQTSVFFPAAGFPPAHLVVPGGGGVLPPVTPPPTIPPAVPGVPEPAAWAMLITGFGLVGLAARRPRGSTQTGERA